MNTCKNCEDNGECYECWYMGDSEEAKQAYSNFLDSEIKQVFG